jgi:hypothetical protein
MRHRLNAGNINRLHVFDQSEHASQLRQRGLGFSVINGDPRQVRCALHIVEGQGHEESEKTVKNKGCVGYHTGALEGTKIR